MPLIPTDYSIKRKVEEAFADVLNQQVTGARTYTSKGDEADVLMPYIAVIAQTAREIIPRSNAFEIEAKVVLVSSIANATSDDHERLVALIKDALDGVAVPWSIPGMGMLINGFAVTAVTGSGSDADETWGDVWTLKVGAQG